jgi:hypothetical protein
MSLCKKCRQMTEDVDKRPRGRPKKYITEEEWREAKRLNSRNTYKAHPEEMKAARREYKKVHSEAVKAKAKERYERKKDADKLKRLLKRIESFTKGAGEAAKDKLREGVHEILRPKKEEIEVYIYRRHDAN